MKVIQKHNYKSGKFIFTREVSGFTDEELSVLRKLYENNGNSLWEDEYYAKYNSIIFNFEKIGLIYKDYENSAGTKYQMSKCVKDILEVV